MLFEVLQNIVGVMGLLLAFAIIPMVPLFFGYDGSSLENRLVTIYFTFVFIWFVLAMLLAGWSLGEYVNLEEQTRTHEFWRNK